MVFPRLLQLAFTICQPLVLNRFLAFLERPEEDTNRGYGLIGAYGLVYLGIALSGAFYSHQAARAATMLRGILVSAVFARSTGLSAADVDNAAAVTLMSTDVGPLPPPPLGALCGKGKKTVADERSRSTPSSARRTRSSRCGPTSSRS